MKLLMITGDRALASGKRAAFYNTLEELHKHFERIDVICPHVAVRRYEMSVFGNVFVHPSPFPLAFQWLWIFWKGRQVIQRSISDAKDVVMTVHEYAPTFFGVGARLLRWATGVPYLLEVMHITGVPRAANAREWVYRQLFRWFIASEARSAAAVRVINQHEAPDVLAAFGVPRESMVYASAFYIDLDVFRPTDSPRQYDLAFVGRLAGNKGLALFLDVLERTQRVGVVVGDGPLMGWAQRSAKRRKLKVHFTGFVPDSAAVADILNRSKLLLMLSESEGGPRVVLEAMACGIPVIATPVGIVPDVLPPEAIEEWDAGAVADKVANVLGDETLYTRLREGGLGTVRRFERAKAIQEYANVVQRIRSEA